MTSAINTPVTTTEATVTAMTALDLRFDVLRFETWDHLTPSTNDYYAPGAEFLGEARVLRDPPRVTYVLAPAEDEPRVDVIADRAYWVSGLRVRDESAGSGFIDVQSEGFGLAEPEVLPVGMSIGVLTGGNHEPAPYSQRVREWVPPEAAPVRDRLVIHATNIAAVRIHAGRARVSCGAELDIDSNGPVEVTLAGCP